MDTTRTSTTDRVVSTSHASFADEAGLARRVIFAQHSVRSYSLHGARGTRVLPIHAFLLYQWNRGGILRISERTKALMKRGVCPLYRVFEFVIER